MGAQSTEVRCAPPGKAGAAGPAGRQVLAGIYQRASALTQDLNTDTPSHGRREKEPVLKSSMFPRTSKSSPGVLPHPRRQEW